jgi:hypothetical protein
MDRAGPQEQPASAPVALRAPAQTRPPGRWAGPPRRWIIAGVIVLSVCGLLVVGLLVAYPRVGAWMIRDKVGAKVGTRLGREVRIGKVHVSLGHAVLRDVTLRGPSDGNTPLVHIDRIDVDFDPWRSLIGSVRLGPARLDGVSVTLRRAADGTDNVSDLLVRLRAERATGAGGDGGGGGTLPSEISVTRARLLADDAVTSTTVIVAEGPRPRSASARRRAACPS